MKYIVYILIFLVATGCGNQKEATVEEAKATEGNLLQLSDTQLASLKLSTVEIEKGSLPHTLKLNGTVEVPPQNKLSVSTVMGGYLKSTKLLPGMQVRKGEVLAVIENNQFIQLQQDYLTAKAQLQNAESEYHRQKELNLTKASSDRVYLQAKAEYETLQISLNALAQKLSLIHINPNQVTVDNIRQTVNIYAPFDGVVSQVFVNVGKYLAAEDVLFELLKPTDLYLNLKVFEKDWGSIHSGLSVSAYTNADPDSRYPAEIGLVGKHMGSDRSVDVQAKLRSNNAKLIPGMYINAEVLVPSANSWVLPEAAVLSFEGGSYVFERLDKNRYNMLVVDAGESSDGRVAIRNGEALKGKALVLDGAYTLLMALKNTEEE